MGQGLIARKLGMTQLFVEDGTCVGVTVLQAGPCVVVDRRTEERDGYEAVQLGFVEARPHKGVTKPMEGHFKKAGIPPVRILREFPVLDGDPKPGESVVVKDRFQAGDRISVSGTSKGKGFQGVIKRHGFGGGRATHGSMFHRAPGSIGQSAYPSRVFKGVRLPGQMGNKRITTRKLVVIRVDEERNLIMVRGSVPGAKGGYLIVQKEG